jgi:hypothetical protein
VRYNKQKLIMKNPKFIKHIFFENEINCVHFCVLLLMLLLLLLLLLLMLLLLRSKWPCNGFIKQTTLWIFLLKNCQNKKCQKWIHKFWKITSLLCAKMCHVAALVSSLHACIEVFFLGLQQSGLLKPVLPPPPLRY